MRILSKYLPVLLSISPLAGVASATVYSATPSNYRSLISSLRPGDTLSLTAGNYTLLPISGVNGTPSAWITITGPTSGAVARIVGSACCNTVEISNSSYLAVKNLTIDSLGIAGLFGISAQSGTTIPTHDILIENNNLVGQNGNQQTVGISTKTPTWNWTIRGNTITGAGTGMYFGNSDGTLPFVAGVIENNLIQNTIGYNLQIKYQVPRPSVTGMPTGPSRTIIRNNVFIKDNQPSPDGDRPNVLVGGFPDTGAGSTDMYEVYGNFFFHNPRESLFQASGRVSVHDNVFVDASKAALTLANHDLPLKVAYVYNNTVYSSGRGIYFVSSAAVDDAVVGNLVFASPPIGGLIAHSSDNITDTFANAPLHVNAPSFTLGSMDFFPRAGMAQGTVLNLTKFAADTDFGIDFNGASKSAAKGDIVFRGSYAGEGTNPGWRLQAGIKTAGSGGGPGPLAISNVSAASITSSSAIISWTTNAPADSQVAYGATSAYGSTTPVNTTLVTSHTVTLSGLIAGATYHYQVLSRDGSGALATSADLTFTTTPVAQFTPIRINAGSSASYTDPAGQLWSADPTSGGSYSTASAINGTNTPSLYQTERYGSSLTYSFPVPNGSYQVNLKFAEIYHTLPGKRVFSVSINGQALLSGFDIVAQAGGAFRAIDKPFPVNVSNGQIVIQATASVDSAKFSAIEILSGTAAAPVITSITPPGASPGSGVPVTLTGSNLGPNVAIDAGTSVTVSNIAVVSSSQVTATFGIAAGAIGTASVTLTTTGGTSAPVTFTIGSGTPAPTITSVSPNAGVVGTSVPVTVNGTNFLSGSTLAISNPGVGVSAVTVVSSTTITAVLAIGSGASTGPANLTVSTASGASSPALFTVISGAPTLTSIAPNTGALGAIVPVTLTGSNFVAGATVAVSNPGVTVTGVNVVSATRITASFAIASNAAAGAANVTVTTGSGTSSAVVFTVATVAFTPIRIRAGSTSSYTDLLGQVWSADTGSTSWGSVYSTASAITGTNTPALYQAERFGKTLTYAFNVPNGKYTVNLKLAEIYWTQTGKRIFNVAINGATVLSNFDIVAQSGGGFRAIDEPFPVDVTNGRIVIQGVAVADNAKISAIEIIGGVPAAPTLGNVSPSAGAPGSSVSVTLNGSNLGSSLTIGAGSGITVTNVVAVNPTQVTASFTIAAGATAGPANVTLTTAGGTSNPVVFTIN